jgi:TPR repeat protein
MIPIIRSREEFELLKERASQGDPKDQCAVADICADYSRAEFFDAAEAARWYAKAAEQGHPRAQGLLGMFYASGIGGVEKDMDKAEQWLLKSARNGDADGQYALAGIYTMKPDLVKAEYWLEKSAEQGNNEAVAMLGAIKLLLRSEV